ncbi:hypothetical protein BgiBS90_008940, partial [Biomphalaria glabrata]
MIVLLVLFIYCNQKVLETTRGARDYPRPQETTRGRKRLPEAARDYQRPQETTRG